MRAALARIAVILPIFLLISASALSQSIWYVDDDNTSGPWDGSQANPFQHIQDGIDAAADGDMVLVRPGEYVENIKYRGKKITVRSDKDGDPATYDIRPDQTRIINYIFKDTWKNTEHIAFLKPNTDNAYFNFTTQI